MYHRIILFACLLLAIGCNRHGNRTNEAPAGISTKETQRGNEENKNEIVVMFGQGETSVKLNGNINGISDSKTYVFDVREGQTVSASIVPATQPANIRFNLLISPSNKSDGPFGIDLSRKLDESGKWKLVVGESNMNGEDYIGDYTLTITLK